jgi:hypothetical protein
MLSSPIPRGPVYNDTVLFSRVPNARSAVTWTDIPQPRAAPRDSYANLPKPSTGYYFKDLSQRPDRAKVRVRVGSPGLHTEEVEKIDIYNYYDQYKINEKHNDLMARRTADFVREQYITYLRIPNIVDTIIARNMDFLHISKADLRERIDSVISEMSLAELNSIGKSNVLSYFEDAILEEEFLRPGFSLKMPSRREFVVNVNIVSMERRLPKPPNIDFED